MRSPLSPLLSKPDKPRVLGRSSEDMPASPFATLLWWPPRDTCKYLHILLKGWGPIYWIAFPHCDPPPPPK